MSAAMNKPISIVGEAIAKLRERLISPPTNAGIHFSVSRAIYPVFLLLIVCLVLVQFSKARTQSL